MSLQGLTIDYTSCCVKKCLHWYIVKRYAVYRVTTDLEISFVSTISIVIRYWGMTVTAKDIELAEKGKRLLSSRSKERVRFEVGSSNPVELPEPIKEVLEKALSYVAKGKGVSVVPEAAEMTTQQAADLLHISRPFVVKLLENGDIHFRKVGKHRRILTEDVLTFKDRIDKARLKTLEKLTAEAQKLGLGY